MGCSLRIVSLPYLLIEFYFLLEGNEPNFIEVLLYPIAATSGQTSFHAQKHKYVLFGYLLTFGSLKVVWPCPGRFFSKLCNLGNCRMPGQFKKEEMI